MPGTRNGRNRKRIRMETTVTKRFNLHSAHFLPDYPGKCAHMHGHTWDLEISLSGEVDLKTGMVADFSKIKDFLVEPIKEALDHKILNDCRLGTYNFKLPTAENIAVTLLNWCKEEISKSTEFRRNCRVSRIRVWESPDSFAEIEED